MDIDGDESQPSATPYVVDETWFEENNFSFNQFVKARMSAASLARFDEEIEERFTVMDKKSKRASFAFRTSRFGENPVKVIRENCSRQRDYITPDMPTLEAIFRVLLANGNQPMTLEHIREQLAEWCPGGGCQWLLLPLDALERLIQNDRFFGIRPHASATAA